jgi:hypothetical protein
MWYGQRTTVSKSNIKRLERLLVKRLSYSGHIHSIRPDASTQESPLASETKGQ